MHPARAVAEVGAAIPKNAVLVGDTGWNKNGVGQQLGISNPRAFLAPGSYATMGFGPTAVLGAALDGSNDPVIALVGDGAFLTNISVVLTAVEEKIPIVWVVMNNSGYGSIAGLQKLGFGTQYGVRFDTSLMSFPKLAQALGADGARVEKADPGRADAESRDRGTQALHPGNPDHQRSSADHRHVGRDRPLQARGRCPHRRSQKMSSSNTLKAGFIGPGQIGTPMAARLIDGGHPLAVYDVRAAAMQPLLKKGAKPAASPRDMADQCEIVIISLPNVGAFRAVIAGEQGIVHGKAAKYVVNTCTVGMKAVREMADVLAKKNIVMVDCPISGGVPGATAGTLSVMVSGDPAAVKAVAALYLAVGHDHGGGRQARGGAGAEAHQQHPLHRGARRDVGGVCDGRQGRPQSGGHDRPRSMSAAAAIARHSINSRARCSTAASITAAPCTS